MKISINLSTKLPVPGQKFGSMGADIWYTDIDLEEPLEPQLVRAREAALQVAEHAEETLAQLLSDLSAVTVEGLGVVADVRLLNEKLEKVAGVVRAQNEVIRALREQINVTN